MNKEYSPEEAKAWLIGYHVGKKISTSEKNAQTSDTKPEESARTWVKLTDDEINEIFGDYMDSLDSNEDGQTWLYERLIEAKLRDKNA